MEIQLSSLKECNIRRKVEKKDKILVEEQPLPTWSYEQVAAWLSILGFYNYSHHAKTIYQSLIDNETQCVNDPDPFIISSFHRAVLTISGHISCPQELKESPIATLPIRFAQIPDHMQLEHDFQPTNFFLQVACAYCDLPLLGTQLQGLHCKHCGLISHRMCFAQANAISAKIPCLQKHFSHFRFQRKTEFHKLTFSRLHPSLIYGTAPVQAEPFRDSNFLVPFNEKAACNDYEINCLPQQMSVSYDQFFGLKLDEQLTNENNLPEFFSKCLNYIEQKSSQIELIDFVSEYSVEFTFEHLLSLRYKFVSNLPDNQTSLNECCLLLRLFLLELPDPLIPESHYIEFLGLIDIEQKDLQRKLEALLRKIPVRQKILFKAILSHMQFIWSKMHQRKLEMMTEYDKCLQGINSDEELASFNKFIVECDDPIRFLELFVNYVFKPPFEKTQTILVNLSKHLNLLKVLLIDQIGPQQFVAPSFEPKLRISSNTSIKVDSSDSGCPDDETHREAIKQDIIKQKYYWDRSRETQNEIFEAMDFGFFFIRESSDRNNFDYTLTQKTSFRPNLKKIFVIGPYVDFVHPPTRNFKLISELVNYFMSKCKDSHSGVFSYSGQGSKSIELSLLHPFRKLDFLLQKVNAPLYEGEYPPKREFLEKLLEHQKIYHQIYDFQYEKLLHSHEKTVQESQACTTMLKAYEKYQEWMNTQAQRLHETRSRDMNNTLPGTLQGRRFKEKVDQVNSRLKELEKAKEMWNRKKVDIKDVKPQLEEKKVILDAQELLFDEIRRLFALLQLNDDQLQDVFDRFEKPDSFFYDRKYWYVDTEASEQLGKELEGCESGTFFVRPGKQLGSDTLVFNIGGIKRQTRLLYNKQGAYGFENQSILYPSLPHLLYFAQNNPFFLRHPEYRLTRPLLLSSSPT
ncbi:hypothetical protein Ciccas_000588 [Cichlidogyrus casuarinus]|uniref:Uncharacterized protein n=1 Tax=Cichlidogyrus casuarinus TaxID=1844966 RepID=A0ABD2QMK5_9PLAT